jgi:hypothetical protein
MKKQMYWEKLVYLFKVILMAKSAINQIQIYHALKDERDFTKQKVI